MRGCFASEAMKKQLVAGFEEIKTACKDDSHKHIHGDYSNEVGSKHKLGGTHLRKDKLIANVRITSCFLHFFFFHLIYSSSLKRSNLSIMSSYFSFLSLLFSCSLSRKRSSQPILSHLPSIS